MRNYNVLSSLTTVGLLMVSIGCQGKDPSMTTADQSSSGAGDMSNTSAPDASDPNGPGMVRYSYVCDDKSEKTVELPHVRFGATYSCRFMSDLFSISVRDDRVPVEFRLGITGYHGPGTYNVIAERESNFFFDNCSWSSVEVYDGNCPALSKGTISPCCRAAGAQAKAQSCTITVQQHSLTRVSGSFSCSIQADQEGPDTPYSCRSRGKAQLQGSFDFGPQDCM